MRKLKRFLSETSMETLEGRRRPTGLVPFPSHTHNDKHGLITLQSVLKQHPPPLRDIYSLSHLIKRIFTLQRLPKLFLADSVKEQGVARQGQ